MSLRRFKKTSRQQLLFLTIIAAGALLLLFRVVSIVPGLSDNEIVLSDPAGSLSSLVDDPVQLPVKVARASLFAATGQTSIGFSRLPTVVLGVLTIAMAYWLLRKWYGYRLAVFGVLLVATAPWFLHLGRLATYDITFVLGTFALLGLAALWHQNQRRTWLVPVSAIACALLLYTPGFVWLISIALLIERKHVFATLTEKRLLTTGSVLFGLLLVAPIIYAGAQSLSVLRDIAGLPATIADPLDPVKQVVIHLRNLFLGGWQNPVYNVGGLPILDILGSLTFAVGVYLYSRHPRAARTQLLLWLFVASLLLIALNPALSHGVIMPIIAVLSTGGLGYLLHLWLRIFPRNPYARAFGISLIGIVVLFAVGYNLRNYYIAWPNNDQTRAAFQRQP